MADSMVRYEFHNLELSENQKKKMQQKIDKLIRFDAAIESVDVNGRGVGEPLRSVSLAISMNAHGAFFASADAGSFEEALDTVCDALHRQLDRRDGKRQQNRNEDVRDLLSE